jgi:hypothetical protein
MRVLAIECHGLTIDLHLHRPLALESVYFLDERCVMGILIEEFGDRATCQIR